MSQAEENRGRPNAFSRAVRVWRNGGLSGIKQGILHRLARPRDEKEWRPQQSYKKWVALYDTLTDDDRHLIKVRLKRLKYQPLFSVVMPVRNTEERRLRLAIETVLRQLYARWELCIADDCSTAPHVRRVLEEYGGRDKRIKLIFRETSGHVPAASNSALSLASGEFVALLDPTDELAEHALYMVAEELNAFPEADLIYSDEDKINPAGERATPHFKTDWSPDLFYSYNFISHLGVYRRTILEEIGGFREGYEGSQDYDLTLRFVERIPERNIRHIPHVLYHWREQPTSAGCHANAKKNDAHENARRALQSHFERAGVSAEVSPGCFNSHRVTYPLPDPPPLVSLIIGTRDRVGLLRRAVEGILGQTDYDPLEVIIVDNQSADPATLSYLDEMRRDPRVKVLRYDAPFNFSAINNLAARHARGEIIGLINNDIKVIHSDWLREMVSHAARPEIGVVGAKLYYENDTVQHAGVVVGGVVLHAHRHLPRDDEGFNYRARVIQNFSAVTGACLLMRKQVFDEIGGLDEKSLAIAFNDVDLCLRARARGYRVLWTPYAELYHLESVSRGAEDSPEKIVRFLREVNYMQSKWGPVLRHDPYYSPNLAPDLEDFSLAFPPRAPKPWRPHVCRADRAFNLNRETDLRDMAIHLPLDISFDEKYEPAMLIQDLEEAEMYFEACVEHRMQLQGYSLAEAIAAERTYLACYALKYDEETRQRLSQLSGWGIGTIRYERILNAHYSLPFWHPKRIYNALRWRLGFR